MAIPKKPDENPIGITYNISNPKNMIEKANANVHSIMPKIDVSQYHNSIGIVESGNVVIDVPKAARLKKKKSNKAKRKNTRRSKDKKQR